jgi:hypothetical protein
MIAAAVRPQKPDDPVVHRCVPPRQPAQRQAQRVHAVAQKAQHGRQKRERGHHCRDHDEDRSGAEAREDREGHDEHAAESNDDSHTAEEHRAAGRGRGPPDGVGHRVAAGKFLAKTRDDEERVVDADGEAHHRDDVECEHGHGEALAEHRRERGAYDDRDDAEHQRHERRE